jgi:hypothetical protein
MLLSPAADGTITDLPRVTLTDEPVRHGGFWLEHDGAIRFDGQRIDKACANIRGGLRSSPQSWKPAADAIIGLVQDANSAMVSEGVVVTVLPSASVPATAEIAWMLDTWPYVVTHPLTLFVAPKHN